MYPNGAGMVYFNVEADESDFRRVAADSDFAEFAQNTNFAEHPDYLSLNEDDWGDYWVPLNGYDNKLCRKRHSGHFFPQPVPFRSYKATLKGQVASFGRCSRT